MAALSEVLLTTLTDREQFDTLTLSSELSTEHEKIVGAVKSLQSKGDVRLIVKYTVIICILLSHHMDDVIPHKLTGYLIYAVTSRDAVTTP